MAKSFHFIIDDGNFEVNHKGNDVILDLPEWLKDAKGKLNSLRDLTRWAVKNGILLALLHAGIQQLIIKLRAAARPDEDTSILDDKDGAQARVNDFKFEAVPEPGTTGTASKVKKAENAAIVKSINAMRTCKIPDDQIKSVLSAEFTRGQIALAFNEIDAEND